MRDSEKDLSKVVNEAETFVEGLDFHFENGLMVLTRRYLLNRGVCCKNDCRHCPYGSDEAKDLE